MSEQNNPDDNFSRSASSWMIIGGWVLFFLLLLLLFSRLLDKLHNPNSALETQQVDGRREVVLQRNQYGHYVATGTINGQAVVFLVDTGATDVAIPEATAKRLGLKKGYPFQAQTANGITLAYSTQLDSVALGDITLQDIPGSIMSNAGTEEILLGMTFLKHLELNQKGNQLRITQ